MSDVFFRQESDILGVTEIKPRRARRKRGKTPKVEKPKAVRPKFARVKVELPLSQCEAVANYKSREGLIPIAIWKSGEFKRRRWTRCLFVNEETETAYHNEGGFYGKSSKMRDIIPIEPTQVEPAILPMPVAADIGA